MTYTAPVTFLDRSNLMPTVFSRHWTLDSTRTGVPRSRRISSTPMCHANMQPGDGDAPSRAFSTRCTGTMHHTVAALAAHPSAPRHRRPHTPAHSARRDCRHRASASSPAARHRSGPNTPLAGSAQRGGRGQERMGGEGVARSGRGPHSRAAERRGVGCRVGSHWAPRDRTRQQPLRSTLTRSRSTDYHQRA